MILYTHNNKLVKLNNKFVEKYIAPPTIYDVILTTDGHGSITASPMSGVKDTLITLSNTPAQNYVFSKYTLNNVDLAGNTFLMPEADANVKGWFEADMRTITITQPSHGTITAPASAQVGSTVTLSCTPESGYALQYFTVNGSQIQGNSFVMPASNVTVSASISEDPFGYVTIGSQKWMKKNLAVDDGQGGIYTGTVNYGHGDVLEYYYTQQAAVRVASSISGWHLPTDSEFETLINYISSGIVNKLKSTYGWKTTNGIDAYGFCALPAGYHFSTPYRVGEITDFWTATQYSDEKHAFCREIKDTGTAFSRYAATKASKYSVRLVKDS